MVIRTLFACTAALALAASLALADEPATNTRGEAIKSIVDSAIPLFENPEGVLGEDVMDLVTLPLVSDEDAQAIRNIAADTLDNATEKIAEAMLSVGGTEEDAQDMQDSFVRHRDRDEREQPAPDGVTYVIMLSQSIEAGALADIVRAYVDRPDVILIFRGLKPEQNLLALGTYLRETLKLEADEIGIHIDNRPFIELSLESVPAIARRIDGKWEAIAHGTASTDLIDHALERGRKGDLGQHGPVYPIVEEDLVERMQRTAQGFDWDAWGAESVKSFWREVNLTDLPTARENRTRLIDPSFEVARDIVMPNGTVLVTEGTIVNPLHHAPFTQRMIVINATDPKQVELAKTLVDEVLGHKAVTVITTVVDREDGFITLNAATANIESAVFVLQPDMVDAFGLERVPAVVEASGDHFEVREIEIPMD